MLIMTVIDEIHAVQIDAMNVSQLEIITGPYLQHADEKAMTVMWLTNKKCLSWVEVGLDKIHLHKVTNSRNGLLDLNNTIHKIRLKNLMPGQHYFYRVVSKEIIDFSADYISFGKEISSDIFEFETLDRSKQEFSFVLLNDIHDNLDILNPLLDSAISENFDLLFYNGDMADAFYSQEQICQIVLNPSVTHFASKIPFVWVRGNHECRGIMARHLIKYIDNPYQQYYYSFDHGPVHFVILDAGENHYDYESTNGAIGRFEPYRTEQAEWLRHEIQTMNFKNARFRVVICHIPFYFSHDNNPLIEQTFGAILNESNIDVMICGHIHQYRHILAEEGRHDFPIITGGGKLAGDCTLIKVNVTNSQLIIHGFNINGQLLGEVIIPVGE